jgi:hypothetical protein
MYYIIFDICTVIGYAGAFLQRVIRLIITGLLCLFLLLLLNFGH